MKQFILSTMIALLGVPFFSAVSADTIDEPVVMVSDIKPSLPTLSLEQVKLMIRQKETFFLYIGRQDLWRGGETYDKVAKVAERSGQKVYYLDTAGLAMKPYKSFAVKYRIKSPTYLALFGQKRQLNQLASLEEVSEEAILSFLETTN